MKTLKKLTLFNEQELLLIKGGLVPNKNYAYSSGADLNQNKDCTCSGSGSNTNKARGCSCTDDSGCS